MSEWLAADLTATYRHAITQYRKIHATYHKEAKMMPVTLEATTAQTIEIPSSILSSVSRSNFNYGTS